MYKVRLALFLTLSIVLLILMAYSELQIDNGNFDNGFLVFFAGSYIILLIAFIFSLIYDRRG